MMMNRGVSVAALSAVLGLGVVASAGAASLNLNLTADNQFTVYLSSSDSTLGTLIGSGNAWWQTYSFSAQLSGTVEYLHVIGVNWTSNNGLWYAPGDVNGTGGNPDGFIGSFSIVNGEGAQYSFANGSTSLSTDTTDWRAAQAGAAPYSTIPTDWTAPTDAPQSYGLNGVGPWGGRPNISADAEWIWSSPDNANYSYFSTTITDSPAAPEASTWTMLLSGFGALAFAALRRSGKRAPASIVG